MRSVTLTLSLTSLTSFTATLSRPHAKAAQKVEALHATAGRPMDGSGGSGEAPGSGLSWLFGLAQYEAVLRELSAAAKSWHGLSLEQVPRAALAAATLGGSAPSADSEETRRLLEAVPRALLEQLAPYQRDGVAFVLRRAGRARTTRAAYYHTSYHHTSTLPYHTTTTVRLFERTAVLLRLRARRR